MIWPLTLLPRWSGVPRPSTQRFEGLTILITGANSGLGLEAAKKLAIAGTSNLIITTRDTAKGQATKSAIEEHLHQHNLDHTCNVIPLILEMSSPASLRTLITNLKQHTTHLDHAILNAGLMSTQFDLLPTGYETAIQVNTISTASLSLYLVPFLAASRLVTQASPSLRPHLTFVSSSAAWMFDPRSTPFLASTPTPLSALSQPTNVPASTLPGMVDQYGRSKLMLEYLIRRIAFLPYLCDPDQPSRPQIMVNSVDPGPTTSDFFTRYGAANLVERTFLYLFGLVMKAASTGANIYVSALGKGEETRGQMWMNDEVVGGKQLVHVESGEGQKIAMAVWEEFVRSLAVSDVAGEMADKIREVLDG